MMMRTALARARCLVVLGALGLPKVAHAGGLASCPCLTEYPPGVTVNSDGQPTVTIEGVRA
jgi:hypothetical protein